jgi:hypothetical protein
MFNLLMGPFPYPWQFYQRFYYVDFQQALKNYDFE